MVGGTAYRVSQASRQATTARLTATSPRTGATLWALPLPESAQYSSGLSVVGGVAIVPFNGVGRAGGVIAVDLAARKVRWSRDLPPSSVSGTDDHGTGTAYTDGTRVYLGGSSNAINTYRLSDGALLWTVPLVDDQGVLHPIDGLAVANNVVYTGGSDGIVTYDAATGRRMWNAHARGIPVVAGGRVFGVYGGNTVVAFPAAGCGQPTCSPIWSTNAYRPGLSSLDYLAVDAADAQTVFITYQEGVPGPAGSQREDRHGVVARLSAPTGTVQWRVSVGFVTLGLIRGGSTIWLFNGYSNAGAISTRLLGYSATATGGTPLRTINLSGDSAGFPQSLAIGSGTLFDQTWGSTQLIGYRIPTT